VSKVKVKEGTICCIVDGLCSTQRVLDVAMQQQQKKTPWPESASELYRPSDRRLSAKLVPTLADRGCCVVSATGSHGR
jgi:hypothetical protein